MRIAIAIIGVIGSLLLLAAAFMARDGDRAVVMSAVCLLILWQATEKAWLKRRSEGKPLSGFPSQESWPLLALAVVLLAAGIGRFFEGRLIWPAWIGLLTLMAGVGLRAGALIVNSARDRAQSSSRLAPMDLGACRFMKNPPNWGLLFIGLGVALTAGSFWSMIAVVLIMIPSIVYANLLEEIHRQNN